MSFEKDKYSTLDKSVPIIVRSSDDEYIFQFALNKKEILALQKILKKALKQLDE